MDGPPPTFAARPGHRLPGTAHGTTAPGDGQGGRPGRHLLPLRLNSGGRGHGVRSGRRRLTGGVSSGEWAGMASSGGVAGWWLPMAGGGVASGLSSRAMDLARRPSIPVALAERSGR
jgi:hypothetical protein